MKHYIQTLLVSVALLVLAVPSVRADIDNAGDYFKMRQDFGGPNRPYVEFEYADWDSKGNDDALINPEFGIVNHHNNYIRMAKMTRCHDEMTWENTEYGLFSVVGQRGDNPRIITMHYYPTVKGMQEAEQIYHKGWWDIDDDGGKGYDVSRSFNINCNYNPLAMTPDAEVDFDGECYTVNFGIYKNGFSCQGFSHYVTFLSQGNPIDTFSYPNFSSGNREFYTLNKGFKFITSQSIDVKYAIEHRITIKNGSIGSKNGERREITQRFEKKIGSLTGPNYSCIPSKVNSKFDNEGNTVYTISVDYPDYDVDVYRNNGEEYVGRAVTQNGNAIWVDKDSCPFDSYEINFCAHKKTWAKRSYQISLSYHSYHHPYPFKLSGEGSERNPYQISSYDNLKQMRVRINRSNLSDKCYWQLNNDIDLTNIPDEWVSIGTEQRPFNGTFLGRAHTITYNITNEKELQGSLFGVLKGATINELKVSGNIHTSAKYAAGISGRSYGASINQCLVEVAIHSSVNGDGTHGGFIGVTDNTRQGASATIFNNCTFKGSLNGSNTFACGGFVGWSEGDTNSSQFTNCLNLGTFNLNTDACDIFARNKATQTHCFYLNALGSNQTNATQITEADKGVALLDYFGLEKYRYPANDYPELRCFSPITDATLFTDMELNMQSKLVLTEPLTDVYLEFKRSFKQGERCTLMLPFALTANEARQWGNFYKFSSYHTDTKTIIFTPVTDGIQANVPYVFEPAADFDSKKLRVATLEATANLPDANIVNTWNTSMVGTTIPAIVPTGAFGYSAGDAVNGPGRGVFVRVGEQVKLPSFCAYLWLRYAPRLERTLQAQFVDENGNTTGIETLTRDAEDSSIYTLEGVKLSKPQKGINIINGKKVYVP